MKKIVMLLLGAMLVLSMAGVVSAGPNPVTFNETDFPVGTNSKTAEVTVTLVLEEAYEVTIPADIVLTEHRDGDTLMYSGSNWLNATVHLMSPGEGLVVNITSGNVIHDGLSKRWILKTSDGAYQAEYIIGYTTSPSEHIEEANGITEKDQVIAIKDPGMKAELCMHYKLVTPVHELQTKTYTDTLTFGVYILPEGEVDIMSSTYLKPLSA